MMVKSSTAAGEQSLLSARRWQLPNSSRNQSFAIGGPAGTHNPYEPKQGAIAT
jgi:hypothetical protein